MVYSVFKRKVNNRIALWIQNHGKHIPDSLFLKIVFRLRMGYKLNLKHPKTFSEKLQWLKLHDRKPEYTRMVDKYAVKEYVSGLIGEEYVIPTLGVWNRADEINWEELPNQFVLKTTHGGGSGGVVICKDKALLDKNKAIEKLNKSLAEDIYESFREWPYKDVPRRIIAEKYIDPVPMVDDLPDYKWFCFDGEPKYCQVIQDRHKKETIDIFDANWLHQDFIGLNPVAENAIQQPQRPKNLDDHLRIARELSKGIPFARIDLYETNDNTFFGEITLYPASGMGSFRPDDYNYLLGKMLSLPGENGGGVIIRVSKTGELIKEKPDLYDYKFFCFNGEVKCFKIDFNRQCDHHANYFDKNCNQIPHGENAFPPVLKKEFTIPASLPTMIMLAEKIAQGHPFLRVDFYDHNGKVLFGETTFYPASGMGKFTSYEWDRILGDWIKISQ